MINALKEFYGTKLSFEGRMSRRTYWLAVVGQFFLGIVLGIILLIIAMISIGLALVVYFVLGLVIFIYGLIANVKRLHDVNKSGAYMLLAFIPLVGSIILLIALASAGDPDENQYGQVPVMVE